MNQGIKRQDKKERKIKIRSSKKGKKRTKNCVRESEQINRRVLSRTRAGFERWAWLRYRTFGWGARAPRTGTVRALGGKASSLSSLSSPFEGGAPRVQFVHGPPWPSAAVRKPSVPPEPRLAADAPRRWRSRHPQNEAHEVVACADGNASVLAPTLGERAQRPRFGAQIGGGSGALFWQAATHRVHVVHAARRSPAPSREGSAQAGTVGQKVSLRSYSPPRQISLQKKKLLALEKLKCRKKLLALKNLNCRKTILMCFFPPF